jgi:hypothetical protein
VPEKAKRKKPRKNAMSNIFATAVSGMNAAIGD